jgi:hypothetical protein
MAPWSEPLISILYVSPAPFSGLAATPSVDTVRIVEGLPEGYSEQPRSAASGRRFSIMIVLRKRS